MLLSGRPSSRVHRRRTTPLRHFNGLDLGFGRRMIMRRNNGDYAFAVSNFTNVNDAVSGDGLIATVAMEYSPVINGGPRFTKFYVFGADGNRVNRADLDGAGEKYVPGLCIVCHGGQNLKSLPSGTNYPNGGDVGAHFLPFDLRALDYSCEPALTKSAQQAGFKELNRGVLEIERLIAASAQTNARPAIIELIEGWYGGSDLPRETQDEEFVPPGWKDSNDARLSATQAYLYLNVVAPSCRSCHITRPSTASLPLDFRRFDQFDLSRALIALDVFGTLDTNSLRAAPLIISDNAAIKMPHARRTFERFWNSISPRPQPEILREYLLGTLSQYLTPTSRIAAVQRIGTDLRISFTTSNGGSYRVEQADALAPTSLTPIHAPVSGTGGTNHIIQPIEAAQPKRFFQVRSLP